MAPTDPTPADNPPTSADDTPAPAEPATALDAAVADETTNEQPPASAPDADEQEESAPASASQPEDAAPAGTDPEPEPEGDESEDDEPDSDEPDAVEQNPEAIAEGATDTGPPQAHGKTAAASKPKPKAKKPAGPEPAEVVRRVGRTNEDALAYVLNPDPKLSRLSRKAREALITEVPPVTAGALLGPAALARHFIASAAAGRYRDLFALWELFRARPEECKPVLAERQRALERARHSMATAVKLGLRGHAERVAQDVERAQGLIWTWLREVVVEDLAAVGRRPAIAAALLRREPQLEIPLPDNPDDRWLGEAAAAKADGELPEQLDRLLSANVDRLPATVATLSQVQEQYPERLSALVDRIDLDSENIGALLAWARDHGMGDRVRSRIVAEVDAAAAKGRAEGLATWRTWRDRGVDLELPESLKAPSIEGLDLSRPESADVIALLLREGAAIDPQAELNQLAGQNRQLAEKAYESFVCAGLDVHLPLALEGNPIVRDGTRCPACQAWTWVRPGHERRCPRRQEETTAAS